MFRSLMTAALIACAAPLAAQDAPAYAGYDRFDVAAAHRAGLMQASVWYPAAGRTYRGEIGGNAVFRPVSAWVGAPLPQGPLPLIVFSHGSGGNMDNAAWLSSALAQRGAVVVAVNHPGSTSGDSSPRRSIRLWERAQDLHAVLDALLADPDFGPRIDRDRVSVLGFSLGGTTALLAGGARLSHAAYADWCDTQPEAPDCVFWRKGGVDMAHVPPDAFEADVTDPRLTRVVAVDPGMGHAMTPDSLAALDRPVLLISLGAQDTLWPAVRVDGGGADLTGQLPQATHVSIAPADHFAFLGLCTDIGAEILAEERDDPVCDDAPGADRAAVHDRIVQSIAAFLGL